MSGGHTSARSERPDEPQVDVEDRGPARGVTGDQAGEAAWSPTPVLRTRRSRRDRTGLLIAIALVGIAVAAIKPWGAAMPAPSAAAAVEPSAVVAPPASSAPQPTAGPVIADRNAMACLTHQVA